MWVSVYCTVKLFLDTGEVTIKDLAGLVWFICQKSLMLLGQELTKILSENKKSWLRKWILCREPQVTLSNKTWGFQITNSTMLTVALKENRGKKSRCLLLYGKERYKIFFLLWRKLSISKIIEFTHRHPRKPVNWCQGLNLPQWLFGGQCPMMASLLYIFVKRVLKQKWKITRGTF